MKIDPYKFETVSVEGVPVHYKNIPWVSGFVYIRIAVKTGSRQDPSGKDGLVHFFEHLPFNGCKGLPTLDDINRFCNEMLFDSLNASTNYDRTLFTCKVSIAKLDRAMRFLGNFIFHPTLNAKEIERERKVITQEIWKKFENKRTEQMVKENNELTFCGHEIGRSANVIGWHDTVAKISRNDLMTFHAEHYHAGTISVVIVGDIVEHRAIKAVEMLLRECPQGRIPKEVKKIKSWNIPCKQEIVRSYKGYFKVSGNAVPQTTGVVMHRVFPLQQNVEVANIGYNMLSELLFRRIRGKLGSVYTPKLVKNIYSDHCAGIVDLNVPPKEASTVIRIILRTISEIAEQSPKHKKLFQLKKKINGEDKIHIDHSVEEIADTAVEELVVHGEITSVAEDYRSSRSVTYADVAEFFSREFAPHQLQWIIMTP